MADAERLCPDCHGPMQPHGVRDLRLDICSMCGGVWFDAGEFGRLSRRGSRAVDSVMAEEPPDITPAPAAPHQQLCPVDGNPLDRYHFAGSSPVMLAGCSKCAGIFLSHEDLLRLDDRDRDLEHRSGRAMNVDEAAAVAFLDAQAAADVYDSQMAIYNWDQLMKPVPFT
ncbi:MAG TPA: zf-TFIIB domain-containing protein [Fimbriimonadaceae bacterium]|nr:zf-TFIIB domain-containing protein [Fimbriimonadaceae bacterium]